MATVPTGGLRAHLLRWLSKRHRELLVLVPLTVGLLSAGLLYANAHFNWNNKSAEGIGFALVGVAVALLIVHVLLDPVLAFHGQRRAAHFLRAIEKAVEDLCEEVTDFILTSYEPKDRLSAMIERASGEIAAFLEDAATTDVHSARGQHPVPDLLSIQDRWQTRRRRLHENALAAFHHLSEDYSNQLYAAATEERRYYGLLLAAGNKQEEYTAVQILVICWLYLHSLMKIEQCLDGLFDALMLEDQG